MRSFFAQGFHAFCISLRRKSQLLGGRSESPLREVQRLGPLGWGAMGDQHFCCFLCFSRFFQCFPIFFLGPRMFWSNSDFFFCCSLADEGQSVRSKIVLDRLERLDDFLLEEGVSQQPEVLFLGMVAILL